MIEVPHDVYKQVSAERKISIRDASNPHNFIIIQSRAAAEWVYDRPHHWYCSCCKKMYGYNHVTMKYCAECGSPMKPHSYEEALKESESCRPTGDLPSEKT